MTDEKSPNLIDRVKGIGQDAKSLIAALQSSAQEGANLTEDELGAFDLLVKRSEVALSDANARAKVARGEQIDELNGLIDTLTTSLGTPGLTQSTRKSLQKLRSRRRAQLLSLQTREAMDFGGILPASQVKDIEAVLKRAKKDVSTKKKAAGFMASLTSIADISVGLVRKAAGVM